MSRGILARKVGMTQLFTERGTVVPVTVLEAGPCRVVQRKTTAVEDELIQRKAIANEDPLNFPIRLNNMIASLNALVNRGPGAPAQADYDEFNQLRTTTAQCLAEWNQIKSADLASFNALARRENANPITLASR